MTSDSVYMSNKPNNTGNICDALSRKTSQCADHCIQCSVENDIKFACTKYKLDKHENHQQKTIFNTCMMPYQGRDVSQTNKKE